MDLIKYVYLIWNYTKGGNMVPGTILILAGLLIAIYPPLLSIIVAMVLVLAGIFVFTVSYRYKKMAKKSDDPFIDFFMRI